jgi:type I restriction enzyme, S subunit
MSRKVPEGWVASRLGDAAANVTEKWEPGEPAEPYVGLEQIDQGTGRLLDIGVSDDLQSIKTRFRAGDVLFGKLRPNLRKTALVDFSGIASTDILVIRPTARMTPEFAFYRLSSDEAFDYAIKSSAGTKMPRTSWKDMADLEFPLPPLHEQRRIAEILSSVDEAISAMRAVIEQTRKVKQGVLERLLTKGIGHTRFKQTEIGEIPEGWEVKHLEDIAEIDRGKFSVRPRNDPRYFGGNVPFVQTGDVVSADGRLRKHSQTLNALGKSVSKEFPAGTILITIAANIGDTAITTYPVCCPDSVVGIVPSNGVNTDWLREFLVLQKSSLDRQATQNAQKNINLQHLRPMQIAVPPADEQHDIGRCIQAMNDSISENGLELANWKALKSALMFDLLTGRKRVTGALPMAAE